MVYFYNSLFLRYFMLVSFSFSYPVLHSSVVYLSLLLSPYSDLPDLDSDSDSERDLSGLGGAWGPAVSSPRTFYQAIIGIKHRGN